MRKLARYRYNLNARLFTDDRNRVRYRGYMVEYYRNIYRNDPEKRRRFWGEVPNQRRNKRYREDKEFWLKRQGFNFKTQLRKNEEKNKKWIRGHKKRVAALTDQIQIFLIDTEDGPVYLPGIRALDLYKLTPMSPNSWYRLMQAQYFPEPELYGFKEDRKIGNFFYTEDEAKAVLESFVKFYRLMYKKNTKGTNIDFYLKKLGLMLWTAAKKHRKELKQWKSQITYLQMREAKRGKRGVLARKQ